MPLSSRRMLLGLAAAAIVGLTVYIGIILGANFLERSVATFAFGKKWGAPSPSWGGVQLTVMFGLPLSLIFSIVVGVPLWKYAERRRWRTIENAILLAAAAGAMIGMIFTVVQFIWGLMTYLDVNSSSSAYRWGYLVMRNGLLTPLGWALELLDIVYLSLAGAVAGLVARWVALPKGEGR